MSKFKVGDIVQVKDCYSRMYSSEYCVPGIVKKITTRRVVVVEYLSGESKGVEDYWTETGLKYAKEHYLDEFANQL